MKRKINSMLVIAGFWALVFFAFWEGEAAAQNILLVFMWVFYPVFIATAYMPDVKKERRIAGTALPRWFHRGLGFVEFLVFAANGWLFTAALVLITEMHDLYVFDYNEETGLFEWE